MNGHEACFDTTVFDVEDKTFDLIQSHRDQLARFRPIGSVDSPVTDSSAAPRQGNERASDQQFALASVGVDCDRDRSHKERGVGPKDANHALRRGQRSYQKGKGDLSEAIGSEAHSQRGAMRGRRSQEGDLSHCQRLGGSVPPATNLLGYSTKVMNIHTARAAIPMATYPAIKKPRPLRD